VKPKVGFPDATMEVVGIEKGAKGNPQSASLTAPLQKEPKVKFVHSTIPNNKNPTEPFPVLWGFLI